MEINKSYSLGNGGQAAKTDRVGTAYAAKAPDYQQILREYMDRLMDKIKHGGTESVFPIGADAFTEKEWDELIEKVDAVQNAERERRREEWEKREYEKIVKEIIKEKELRAERENKEIR